MCKVSFIGREVALWKMKLTLPSNIGQVKSSSGLSWACRTVTMADMVKTLVSEETVYFQVFIHNCWQSITCKFFTARGQLIKNGVYWCKKAFCVLQFVTCESIVMVQCPFRTKYHKDPPTDKPIHTWYNNFEQTGSLSAGKRTGRPSVSHVDAERAREAFTQSLQGHLT